jgi:[ribosomal protein S5]-alanine N-acetyltransferase
MSEGLIDPYFLKGERLGFRFWSEEDFPLARELWGDVEVTRYFGGPFSDEQVRVRLEREIARMKTHNFQYWPIFLLSDNQHVGCCGLRPYGPDNAIPELGFHLRPKFWGQGLAVEAARAVITFAFERIGAEGLVGGHHPENANSKKVMAKLAFQYTQNEFFTPAWNEYSLLSGCAAPVATEIAWSPRLHAARIIAARGPIMNYVAFIQIRGQINPAYPGWIYMLPLWPLGVLLLWTIWKITRDSKDEKEVERSLTWPEVQGTVISGKTVWAHVEITYEYWVLAQRYEAVHKIALRPVAVGGTGITSARSAEALTTEAKGYLADFPVGAKIIVRYNRSNPQESVLYCSGKVKPPGEEPTVEPHFMTME